MPSTARLEHFSELQIDGENISLEKQRELRGELIKALVVECEIYENSDLEIHEIMGNTSEMLIWSSILGSRINLSGIVSRRMDHENEGTEVLLSVHQEEDARYAKPAFAQSFSNVALDLNGWSSPNLHVFVHEVREVIPGY